uniref:Uncharacterized protein n=1 Tax=Strongyloides papillosus TaxID=174720 RepID=A0A0N5BJQ5_STREA
MFLKIFTVFITFLISKILTFDYVYKNNKNNESFKVIVFGTSKFNTSEITNANATIYLYSHRNNGVQSVELKNGGEFILSMYKPSNRYLEYMFVRFEYLKKGIYESFDKNIPKDCKNKNEEIEFPSFGFKYLKKENFNCNLGEVEIK